MHNIGKLEEAEFILRHLRSRPTQWGRPDILYTLNGRPEGWKYINKGCDRSAWLSPSGVVYKVEHRSTYSSQNESEASRLKEVWKRPPIEGCRFPKFDIFTVGDEIVIAMEMIDGPRLADYKGPDYDDLHCLMYDLEDKYGLCDVHDENVLVDEDGILVLVDLGG